jgi:hypothetical protein
MIYRGPGFLAVGSSPAPSPLLSRQYLDRRRTERLRTTDNLLTGAGVGEEPNHTTARKLGPLYIIQYSLLNFIAEL